MSKKFKKLFILPTGKKSYLFAGAGNRVDAFDKIKRNTDEDLSMYSYKSIMSGDEYFLKKKRGKK